MQPWSSFSYNWVSIPSSGHESQNGAFQILWFSAEQECEDPWVNQRLGEELRGSDGYQVIVLSNLSSLGIATGTIHMRNSRYLKISWIDHCPLQKLIQAAAHSALEVHQGSWRRSRHLGEQVQSLLRALGPGREGGLWCWVAWYENCFARIWSKLWNRNSRDERASKENEHMHKELPLKGFGVSRKIAFWAFYALYIWMLRWAKKSEKIMKESTFERLCWHGWVHVVSALKMHWTLEHSTFENSWHVGFQTEALDNLVKQWFLVAPTLLQLRCTKIGQNESKIRHLDQKTHFLGCKLVQVN